MAGIKHWLWLIVAALVVAGAAYVVLRPKPLVVDVLIAAREDVQTSVVASGRVLAPARVDVGATITGRVQRVAVREGARVAQGDLLVLLEQQELNAALAQARAARDRAQARMASVSQLALPTARESQVQAASNVVLAEREFKRTQELAAKGFVSQSRLDESDRQLQVARSQLATTQSQVTAQGAQGAEAQQVRQQWVEANAAIELAQAKLAQTEIRALSPGVVLERVVEPGEIAQPAKRMMTLALDGPSRLIVQVDEKNLPLLQLGRTAIATVDAFPTERFAAVIAYISPGVDAARGTVELRLDIPKPPAFLKSDMTVSIELAGPLLKQALLLPADAIRQLQSNAPYAVVVRGGEAVRVALSSGLQMQGRVQVVKGVESGDAVILSREVQPGAAVKARR